MRTYLAVMLLLSVAGLARADSVSISTPYSLIASTGPNLSDTSNALAATGGTLKATTATLGTTSGALSNTAAGLASTSGTLGTTSGVLGTTSASLKTTATTFSISNQVLSNDLSAFSVLLSSLTAISTYTYVTGWANGESYQQMVEEGAVGAFGINCSSPTAFVLTQTSTTTFDSKTCTDVIGTIEQQLFALSLSTPTVVP